MSQNSDHPVSFEELDHTADWKIRVWGKDYADLFRNAALAMYTMMGQKVRTGPEVTREVETEAVDYPSLMVAWLNELLFYSEVNEEIYDDVEILEISPQRLRARVRGFVGKTELSKIKAATYHELEIRETEDGLQAIVVFDV